MPDELLRAGVYVPESRESLETVASRSAAGTDGAHQLLSTLADRPDLLDEAVRGMSAEVARRGVESLLPLEPGDLLLAAPLARECGLPVRAGAAEPTDADAGAGTILDGERVLAVTAIHDQRAWSRTVESVRRAGGEAVGCLCILAWDEDASDEVSSLVSSNEDTRSTDHVNQ